MVTAQICESGSPTLDACDFETCSMSDHYMSTRTYVQYCHIFPGTPSILDVPGKGDWYIMDPGIMAKDILGRRIS